MKEDDFDSLLSLANIYKQINQTELAVDYYLRAQKTNPNNFLVYYNIAILFQDKKYYSNAIENYKKAINLNTKFLSSYINLAECYKFIGETKNLLIFTNIKEFPNEFAINNNLGLMYQEKNDLKKHLNILS